MKLAALFRFVLFATLLGLASNVWVGERAEQLQTSQTGLLTARLNAINQLRLLQSEFDALPSLVAAYVVSKNSRHLVNYYELLDTHAGTRWYAEDVDNGYWSQLIAGSVKPVPLQPGRGDTLEDRLLKPDSAVPQPSENLQTSVDQILKLSESLREREQIVLALTQGMYDPVTQQHVSDAPVRDDLAIQMLFSEEYLGMSNAIRAEIQARIRAVETGFQAALSGQADTIRSTASFDLYLGVLVTIMALMGLGVLQRFVVKPLRELNEASQQIAVGNYSVNLPEPKLVTEMNNLVKGFALMIGAFRRELEQGEAARQAELMALEAKMGREKAEAQAQARSMLLANMSHEIRTPMNAILGMTALTLKSNLQEQDRNYLLKVQDAARSLLGLLNDILDFSKAESGMMEFEQIPFMLDEVLANSFLAVQNQAASRKLLLLNEVVPGFSSQLSKQLVGDPSRLRQVLSNLLSNAVKFTETGAIRVCSSLTPLTENKVNLRIEVHDTGSGLSKSQIDRIFDKFAQANASVSRLYGGTGLGLSIARELVTQMGGQISVESTPGKGSCFWFSVPLVSSPDILVEPLPAINGKGILLYRAGGEANCLISVLRSVGVEAMHVESLDECSTSLKQGAAGWIVLEPDLLNPLQPLPGQLSEQLDNTDLRLITVNTDLLSADSTQLQLLPPEINRRLVHLAHPVLAQDLISAFRTNFQAEQSADPLLESQPGLKGKNVLVLEDHPVNLELVCTLLRAAGMNVQWCQNGEKAMELLEADSTPDIDVILTDLEMPNVDGYEFTAWLRDQTRWMETPLIGLTGHAFPEVRTRCLDLGMDDFITKPIEAEALYAALAKSLKTNSAAKADAVLALSLPNLFLQHCSDLPARLQSYIAHSDEAAFQREIHSMASVMALLGEDLLHLEFREFEQGLSTKKISSARVLVRIEAVWPALVEKHSQQIRVPHMG